MLIWHYRWKHFSLSHFCIRSDVDLALSVKTFQLEPLLYQIWFRSGIMGWNISTQATSVSDLMLIWHYRWKHFSLSHFRIRSDLDPALWAETWKLEPRLYRIWCWSGIIDKTILAWATSVSDLMLIWHYRWKYFSLSHFCIRSDLDPALWAETWKLEPLLYRIWCWSGIIDKTILAWATSVSDLMLIWHYRWKHFSLSHFRIRSDLDLALWAETFQLEPLRYQIWCWSGIIGENVSA